MSLMNQYENLEQLVAAEQSLDWDAWLYVDRDAWARDPLNAVICYATEDEVLEGPRDANGLPSFASQRRLARFLELEMFRQILKKQRAKNPNSAPTDFAKAITYYREHDTFLS
jgi:hypothetical protein